MEAFGLEIVERENGEFGIALLYADNKEPRRVVYFFENEEGLVIAEHLRKHMLDG